MKANLIRTQTNVCEKATFTPLESTRITGFGIQATYKMLRAGTIPHIKVGMRFYIPKSALAHWMETCGGQQACFAHWNTCTAQLDDEHWPLILGQVAFSMTGDLERAARAHGDRGYRY